MIWISVARGDAFAVASAAFNASIAPGGEGWWDVPVAQVSTLESTASARSTYESQVTAQRSLLGQEAAL